MQVTQLEPTADALVSWHGIPIHDLVMGTSHHTITGLWEFALGIEGAEAGD
jgi:hypothetical protein